MYFVRLEGSAVMQLLTFEHIDSNLGEVEYSCLTLANHASADIDMWEVRHKLKQVEMAVFRAPNSDETPAYIAQIWTNVASLQGEEALSAVQQRQRRAGIMSTNYWAWRWLDGYCTQLIEKAFHNPAPDICQASWITRLAKDVRNALENRMNTRIFDPAVYSTSISGDTFTYECSRPPYLADSGPELLQQTLVLTTTIIAQWLEFPVNSPARQQAWFVHALFITVGDQALLLDEVWLAHSDLRKYVLGNAKQKEEVVACFEHLRDALREHPLAQDGSQERQMLSAMSSLINNACNGSLKYTPLVDSFEFASAETPPAPEELEELDIEAEEPESEEDVGRSTQGLLGVAAEKILQRFIDFLTESAAAALDDLPSPNTFQTELLRRMDYICPFRELAPSRLRAAGPEGPFTPALCRTDEGMYSALLYRGVTFGTEFQMQYPMVYEDAAEFHDCNERASEEYWEENDRAPEPSFFCKSDAFGPPNWRRNISLVDTYYTQIRQFGWAQQFESRDQIPFLECWEFVREPEHFPVLGPLAGYLLTADMSYTGAVIPPTIDDIATVIWDMNKGAAKALEILQLIPARKVSVAGTVSKADKHTVRKAVRSLYKRLETMLPAQLRRSVGFDPIVLEHALCKFSRCIAKKWFFLHPNKRAGGKRKGNARARRQAVKPN